MLKISQIVNEIIKNFRCFQFSRFFQVLSSFGHTWWLEMLTTFEKEAFQYPGGRIRIILAVLEENCIKLGPK